MVAGRYSEALAKDDNITGDGDSESIDAGLGDDTVMQAPGTTPLTVTRGTT